MKSVWKRNQEHPHYDPLKGDIKADVLVIGGGITGLLCAHRLKKAGVDCVVAEAGNIAGGVTGNTTAKITAQHGLIYQKLIKKFGVEKPRMYLEANLKSVSEFCRMASEIDCDFENKDSYVYLLDDMEAIEKELDALHKLKFSTSYVSRTGLPFEVKGAVKFENQAQFNPLKFLNHISQDLNIYENTRILGIDNMTAVTEHGSIKADCIIVATHFPFFNKHGSYFLKLFQERSYVATVKESFERPDDISASSSTSNALQVNGMFIDGSGHGLSFRNYGEYLLVGGGSHRTGKEINGGWAPIERFTEKYYPGCEIKYKWATQDCMTLDGVPYIGRYSKMTPGLYVATGFNKWGMTSSMAASMILTDMITGKENQYASVFDPSRTIMRKQLFINGFEAAKNLLTPTKPRCTHLGCALKWNSDEHTWDCPCHGSRFTEEGKIINEPAQKDAKI